MADDSAMTETTDPLRVLAIDAAMNHEADLEETLFQFGRKVQALQRGADAQIADKHADGSGLGAAFARQVAYEIRVASEPRADTSDVSSGPQAELVTLDAVKRAFGDSLAGLLNALIHFGTFKPKEIAHAVAKELFARLQQQAAHASLVQEMEMYLQHLPTCVERSHTNETGCTCGLSALLRRSAAPGTET